MKERGVLHPELARTIASMGHGDLLCVADAGLAVPPNVERIDLAFAPGRPGFLDVVAAVLSELRVEAYVVADESRSACPEIIARLDEALRGIECLWVSHDELKHRCEAARAVVRTGEFTPYANVILRSGVDFSAGPDGRAG